MLTANRILCPDSFRDETVYDAVDGLLATYRENGGTDYTTAAATLPSRRAINATCADLLALLFPGFHGDEVGAEDLRDLTTRRLTTVHRRLTYEVCKSLYAHGSAKTIGSDAEEMLRLFFSGLAGLRQIIWADIDAAYEGDPAAKCYEEIILAYPGIEALAIQRMAHLLYEHGVPLIPRMMTEWAHSRTGIDIHPGASIGSHCFIDHGTGIVIGETSVVGSRVKLFHGVTLGARSFQKDDSGNIRKGGKRHPNVEDGVTIYPNSTILGGDTVVGARSTIGGNVFLTRSVPPDSLVYYEVTQIKVVPKHSRGAGGHLLTS